GGGGYAVRDVTLDRGYGRAAGRLGLRLAQGRGGGHHRVGERRGLADGRPRRPARAVLDHGACVPRPRHAGHERLDPQPCHDRHGDDRRVRNCLRQGATPRSARSRQRRRAGDCPARRWRHGAGLARQLRREVPTMSASPRTLTALFFDAAERYAHHAAAFRYTADGAWHDVTHPVAAVFCSTATQVDKIRAVRGAVPSLRHVIVFDRAPGSPGDGVLALTELEARGRAAAAKYPRFKEEALAVRPDELATLIYTSGTTGQPKGVMLTHDNICSNVRGAVETIRVSDDDSCLALLPLSHILERMVDYYFLHV